MLKKTRAKKQPVPRTPWLTHFFQRHVDDDGTCSVPAREFLLACPDKVRATMLAVVKAVADAPPPMFSGGGMWEAMHDEMTGYFEVLGFLDDGTNSNL